jgi:hypothetical protein
MWGSLDSWDQRPMARTMLIVDDYAAFRVVAEVVPVPVEVEVAVPA